MADWPFLKVNLVNESEIKRSDFELSQKEITKIIKTKHEQKRKDKHEDVKHLLAGIIIIPYIFLLIISVIWGFEVPKPYETLALIIIGYYFAKYL